MVDAEPHYLGNFDATSLTLFRKAKVAEAKGDYVAALRFMQLAATRMRASARWGFETWDDLATLYCKQARREKGARRSAALRAAGRAMLNEFRCAADVWTNKRACWLPWLGLQKHPDSVSKYGPYVPGFVPNPTLTPLCFRTLCGVGFGATMGEKEDDRWGTAMEAEPPEGWLSWPEEDGRDLPQIEKLCRADGRSQ